MPGLLATHGPAARRRAGYLSVRLVRGDLEAGENMSATICRVCKEKYPGPGHECPTEAQRERSPSSVRIYTRPDHMFILGVTCSKCGHEEEVRNVSLSGDAIRTVRAEALEEAAKTCREYAHSGDVSMMRRQVAYACERRVRELTESG